MRKNSYSILLAGLAISVRKKNTELDHRIHTAHSHMRRQLFHDNGHLYFVIFSASQLSVKQFVPPMWAPLTNDYGLDKYIESFRTTRSKRKENTLRSMGLAPLWTAEAVRTKSGFESKIRPASDSAENPANTTECTAPILAHASCIVENLILLFFLFSDGALWNKRASLTVWYLQKKCWRGQMFTICSDVHNLLINLVNEIV